MKRLLKPLLIFLFFAVALSLVLLAADHYRLSIAKPLPSLKAHLQPGSCLVLEQKYCSKGKAVYKGNKLVYLGFNLPKNTALFSPFSGDFSNTPTFYIKKEGRYITYPGVAVNVYGSPDQPIKKGFSAVFYSAQKTKPQSFKVEKGALIGRLSGQKLKAYGNYNLLVRFSEAGADVLPSVNEKLLKELFSL